MPTADELISPASIRDLARVLRRPHPASQWGSVQAAAGQLGTLGLSDRAQAVAAAIASDGPGMFSRDPPSSHWQIYRPR
jgi:hypothetical protein